MPFEYCFLMPFRNEEIIEDDIFDKKMHLKGQENKIDALQGESQVL